ncbi:hypothetical protein [Streptomyces sp. NBC_00102]|uniref:hypothetical protein n=1 Tax=Streptomyces sp. NBC_00102 TaxID=2975652 RepID=UPI002258A5D8|nr:hypothetical protein [Streptomyces sp. NBC_00102]MCX5401270.1 hypothetical protein [Streptomyces sp. NBC_00102]
MHADTVSQKTPRPHGRRRRHAGPARQKPGGGPVFVDASGRRARLLRRAGAVLGLAVVGYAAVLALAFMGGISMSPSRLLPFDTGQPAEAAPGGIAPPDGSPRPTDGATPPTADAR